MDGILHRDRGGYRQEHLHPTPRVCYTRRAIRPKSDAPLSSVRRQLRLPTGIRLERIVQCNTTRILGLLQFRILVLTSLPSLLLLAW
jgi:hypothetical protein